MYVFANDNMTLGVYLNKFNFWVYENYLFYFDKMLFVWENYLNQCRFSILNCETLSGLTHGKL